MLNMCKKGLQTNCFLKKHRTGPVMLFTYPLCLVLSKCVQRTASETMRPWHRKWHFGLRSSMRRSPSTMSWAGSFWVVKITWICTVRELCCRSGKTGGEDGPQFALRWSSASIRIWDATQFTSEKCWKWMELDTSRLPRCFVIDVNIATFNAMTWLCTTLHASYWCLSWGHHFWDHRIFTFLSSCDESESILLSPSHLVTWPCPPSQAYFKLPVTSYKGRSSSSHGSSKAESSHRMSPLNCCCRRITAKAACCVTNDVFACLTWATLEKKTYSQPWRNLLINFWSLLDVMNWDLAKKCPTSCGTKEFWYCEITDFLSRSRYPSDKKLSGCMDWMAMRLVKLNIFEGKSSSIGCLSILIGLE